MWEMYIVLYHVSRQTLTDCILKTNKKKEVKPRYRIHELSRYKHFLHTHSFMSEGARNKLRDERVCVCLDSRSIDIHLYMSTIQTWTHKCIHTVHNVQSNKCLFFVHMSWASLFNILFGKFCICVQRVQVYIYTIYVYSIHFASHKKMHCILLRHMLCLQVFLAEDGL